MWKFMPEDCPVGKVEVELRFSVQLELSTVVGKSPLLWIFTLGVTNQGANPPIDTFKIFQGAKSCGCGYDPIWSLWFGILSFLSRYSFLLSNYFHLLSLRSPD
jgi:hypothetical protein